MLTHCEGNVLRPTVGLLRGFEGTYNVLCGILVTRFVGRATDRARGRSLAAAQEFDFGRTGALRVCDSRLARNPRILPAFRDQKLWNHGVDRAILPAIGDAGVAGPKVSRKLRPPVIPSVY